MNVLFVSQCSKRALTETRRILDQFAERRGDRTWQTPITAAGLDTVRKLLRQSARKNTAVACHWIRGRDHSELLWATGASSTPKAPCPPTPRPATCCAQKTKATGTTCR
jgi:CRISPR-associated endonuclease/helicase Cas3